MKPAEDRYLRHSSSLPAKASSSTLCEPSVQMDGKDSKADCGKHEQCQGTLLSASGCHSGNAPVRSANANFSSGIKHTTLQLRNHRANGAFLRGLVVVCIVIATSH